jgi:hypothetical protein
MGVKNIMLAEIARDYPARRLPSEAQLLSIEQTGRLPRQDQEGPRGGGRGGGAAT